MKQKVTIQQIADAVNMSKYAVSRAISGKSGVSQETRSFIVETAQQMGYKFTSVRNTFSLTDNAIQSNQIQTVLVLFPNVMYQNKDSIYWGPIFNGISNRLNELKINILTLTEPSHDSIFTLLNPDAIQGVIVVGSVSTQTLLDLKRLNIPMVIVDHLDRSIACDTIFIDNYTAVSSIMDNLINKGYHSFQFIGQVKAAHSFFERWIAYKSSLEAANISYNQNKELINFELHLKPLVREIYKKEPLPQVFVCANDVYAYFAKEALDELGFVINKDYILTGFDNTYDEIELYATVNVLKEKMGERAVDQITWRIKHLNMPFERKLIHANVLYLS